VHDAVFGCSTVRDCWFLRCRRALRLSNYHDRFATQIEYVVFENNLVDDVQELVSGDTGAARDALRGKLKTVAPLGELKMPWPPLPECLQLAADSAGKGCGMGGRDLGPMAGGEPAEAILSLPWSSAIASGWLAAPVEPPANWRKPSAVGAGAKVGNRWWATADADADGLLHLKGVFGPGRTGGLLALPFETTAASKACDALER